MDNLVRYDTASDAQMRLSGTVCRVKGRAAYMIEAHSNSLFTFVTLRPTTGLIGQTEFVGFNSPDLDVSSVPLGWCDIPHGPVFFSRDMSRQQQQGVSLKRIHWFDPMNDRANRGWSWSSYQHLVPFGNMVDDATWPGIAEASGREHGAPLSRDWCIWRDTGSRTTFVLYHLDSPVGVYSPRTQTFLFSRDALTKTRRMSFEALLNQSRNVGGYVVDEQS